MTVWRQWVEAAIGLVYPRNCQLCLTEMGEGERGVVCAACLGKVKFIEPPFCKRCALPFDGAISEPFTCGYCHNLKFHFERAVAACKAEGVVRDCIHRLKYSRQMYFAPHLTDWLVGGARQRIEWREVDAIVPVPLHPRKQREREFNQAQVLAKALSMAVGVPVITNALRRVKDTGTQTRLSAGERRANLRDAFAARRPESVAGKRLVLVDDVFTTGATLDSCANVLTSMGAPSVVALAVARGV